MIDIDQVSLVSSAAALIVELPGGTGSVTLVNTGANPVYVGISNGVTKTNGFELTSSGPPVVFPTYESSKPQALWAVSATGVSTIGFIVSDAH